MKYELKIMGHRNMAFLGLYEHEQASKREIIINIIITFNEPPKACFSDDIEDTVCYDSIINIIDEILSSNRFKLVEHITHCIYNKLSIYLKNYANLSVEVVKPNPNDKIDYSSFLISS